MEEILAFSEADSYSPAPSMKGTFDNAWLKHGVADRETAYQMLAFAKAIDYASNGLEERYFTLQQEALKIRKRVYENVRSNPGYFDAASAYLESITERIVILGGEFARALEGVESKDGA